MNELPISEEENVSLDINVVALAGGVGGAKLAVGLQEVLTPGNLTVIVNTADDFEHWGLTICPDIDTVMYNLAGIHNPKTGWGRADDSFTALETMAQLGGEDWFLLGDRDIALHLRRTEWLRQGISLTEVTERLRRSLGIPSTVLPMSDSNVRTLVHTEDGDMPFQHYFVRHRAEPILLDLTYVGADRARPSESVLDALHMADVVVFCPSNPYLSIDPILHVPGMRDALHRSTAPIVAVSPIVGGRALKGPAAKMMAEMGHDISPMTVAGHYADLLDGFVIDAEDEAVRDAIDMPVLATDTIMSSMDVKRSLAREVLGFAHMLQTNEYTPEFSA